MEEQFRHVAPDPGLPHDDLPPPPGAATLETRNVLKASIDGRDALARLRTSAATLPNPAIVINAIPLLEARDSSRIENIVTTSDELFRHPDPGTSNPSNPAVKEALRYRTALMTGFRSLEQRPVTTRTAVDVVGTLLGTEGEVRRVPGTVLKNATTGAVVYTPPIGEDVLRAKLTDWERFVHDDSVDALVRMAAGHYQFEAIHPFTDGNGRTGRILNTLLLVEYGLLDQPLLYLSRFMLEHRQEYYRRLSDVTFQGAWQPWIEFILRGVAETANWTAHLIEQIVALMQETDARLRSELPKLHSHDLVQTLFTYPYVRITNVVDAGVAKRQTSAAYLQRLVEHGVVDEVQSGREKLFINRPLLALLTGDVSPG